MTFTNKSIKAPRKDKPHIVKIGGYWRVSQMSMRNIQNRALYIMYFSMAHEWVCNKNKEIAS